MYTIIISTILSSYCCEDISSCKKMLDKMLGGCVANNNNIISKIHVDPANYVGKKLKVKLVCSGPEALTNAHSPITSYATCWASWSCREYSKSYNSKDDSVMFLELSPVDGKKFIDLAKIVDDEYYLFNAEIVFTGKFDGLRRNIPTFMVRTIENE